MAEPYEHKLEHITDISKFVKYDDKKKILYFTGDTLEIRVLRRMEVYGLLEVSDTVQTIGIADLIIDGKYQATLNMLAVISIEPTTVKETEIDGVPYLVLTLKKNDVFIQRTQVVQNGGIVYAVYVEFITRGKPIYTLTYDELALVFDRAKQMTGSGIGVDRVLFEVIISHLTRAQKNWFIQYRHTDMKGPMAFIRLRSVSYMPTSTSSRIIGSYHDDGVDASLLTTAEKSQPFEDMLRGIPLSVTDSHDDGETIKRTLGFEGLDIEVV